MKSACAKVEDGIELCQGEQREGKEENHIKTNWKEEKRREERVLERNRRGERAPEEREFKTKLENRGSVGK